MVRSQAHGREFPAEWIAVDLAMPALFLAISAGVVVLLLRPATRRDFQAGGQEPGTPAAG